MLLLGLIGFAAPWALAGFVALPLLWWLLRLTPPPPQRVRFPALRLLREIVTEETPAATPWWLILLRLTLATLLILGLADPVWKPAAAPATGPLLIVIDNGWAAAANWTAEQAAIGQALDGAARAGRRVALLATAPAPGNTAPAVTPFAESRTARGAAEALQPEPWAVDRGRAAQAITAANLPGECEILWLADGIDAAGTGDFTAALAPFGRKEILLPAATALPLLLAPPSLEQGVLSVPLRRAATDATAKIRIEAKDVDAHIVATGAASFGAGAATATATIDLPNELSGGIDRLTTAGNPSAGTTVLLDTRWRQRNIGLVSNGDTTPLSGSPYLKTALETFGTVEQAPLATLLTRKLSTLVLDDPVLTPDDAAKLSAWVEQGGTLIRFAGPHLAEEDIKANNDTLLPVTLRQGDRALGGELTWDKPEALSPFPATGPFAGLPPAPDVTISRQVLADPSPDLGNKVWATLTDGTPLVTGASKGKGWIVLVHTTAGPDWSTLSLSHLFVAMLQRLTALGPATEAATSIGKPVALAPVSTLDGFGTLAPAPATALPIEAGAFDDQSVDPTHPPGYYGNGPERRALNLGAHTDSLAPLSVPVGFTPLAYGNTAGTAGKPVLMLTAFALFLIDLLVALWLKGLLPRRMARMAVLALLLCLAVPAQAVTGPEQAATATTLAYVITGDGDVDAASKAGLTALTRVLTERSSIADTGIAAIDPASDDISLYPLIYWPVVNARTLDDATAAKINAYLAKGGMILFDTEDGESGANPALALVTAKLDIPRLEPVPSTHTLGKSFYLLNDFPGRFAGGTVFVAASPPGHTDSVSPVVIGSADWADAWATDDAGDPLKAVTPGGEHQREMAYRFGVNLVMYALTGNYKSDQVHTPEILKRLGQ
jgi:hypothetical protein